MIIDFCCILVRGRVEGEEAELGFIALDSPLAAPKRTTLTDKETNKSWSVLRVAGDHSPEPGASPVTAGMCTTAIGQSVIGWVAAGSIGSLFIPGGRHV